LQTFEFPTEIPRSQKTQLIIHHNVAIHWRNVLKTEKYVRIKIKGNEKLNKKRE